MAHSHGQRLRLRLFLEGVEVPVIAANIQAAPNSPAVASIQIPPLAEGTRLLPRTIVHLYFLDFYTGASPFIAEHSPNVNPTLSKSPTAYEQSKRSYFDKAEEGEAGSQNVENFLSDVDNERYKLLFGGEVVGFAWTKNQAQRSLVLQCEDWSNYWDYAYQFNNTDIFGPGLKAMFSGGATNLFTDFLSTEGNILTQIIATGHCNSFPKLKGLAAGIIRLIEAIGGSYYPRPSASGQPAKQFAGQNIFFSLAELRLHITSLIAAFEDDPTSQRLLTRGGWTGMFDRLLGGQGGQVSIRKAMNAISGVMFHETYAQPCPLYVPGLEGTVSGQVRVKLKDHPRFGFIGTSAEALMFGLEQARQTISTFEQDTTQFSSLAAVQGSIVQGITFRFQEIRRLTNQTQAQMAGAPDTLKGLFSQVSRGLTEAISISSRWSPQAPEKTRQALADKIKDLTQLLQRVLDYTISTTKPNQVSPARLNQHILRPDIWFGSPPRCNVLFPENYFQLDYRRTFLQEPTRFMLKTNDEFFGEDFLFDKFYFAPATGSIKKDKANLQDMLRNDLLDHELFTGILPVFEKMGEFNVFAAASGTQPAGQLPKIGLAQRSTNFLYFKHRFNSRQMRVSGKFNPYVACGFPGLIVDKYVDEETIRLYNELRQKRDLPLLQVGQVLGTNFLGNFTEVSHVVSQTETTGRTEINCSYPRQPEESTEFLGAAEKAQRVRRRFDEDALRATDVACISPPKLFSLGPNYGRITNVVDVTDVYLGTAEPDINMIISGTPSRLPIFDGGGFRRAGRQPAALVPIGTPVSAADINAPAIEQITGDSTTRVIFRAFRIDEEVPRYRVEQVDLPAEEFIRPGWYGDVWRSSNIGKVYQSFFQTGSITDPQQVTDPSGAATTAINKDAEDAVAEGATGVQAEDGRADAPALLTLDKEASIQQAVEFLVLTYSYIKQAGMDVEEFIRAYTWRPIASMVDMFGTSDLEFTANGQAVVTGFEGFHSRAFGPYDDLFGLVGPDIENILGIKKGSVVAQRGDVRKRRLEQVQQYVSALKFSRAILG